MHTEARHRQSGVEYLIDDGDRSIFFLFCIDCHWSACLPPEGSIPNLLLLALVFPSLVHHYINLPLPAPNRFLVASWLSMLSSLFHHHQYQSHHLRRHDSPWLLPCMNGFSHHNGLPFYYHPGTSSYWNLGGVLPSWGKLTQIIRARNIGPGVLVLLTSMVDTFLMTWYRAYSTYIRRRCW